MAHSGFHTALIHARKSLLFLAVWLVSILAIGMVPTADFTYAFNSGLDCQNNTIQFTNTSTTLSGSIVLTIWDFGDGNGSTQFSPSHIYTTSGTFTVELTVQDSNGDFDVTSQMITVNPQPDVNFVIDAATPDQCSSTTQIFQNLTTIPSGTISYNWDFGDGNNSTDEHPSHDFLISGTFDVSLTATADATGCAATLIQEITIHLDPVAAFNFSNVCEGDQMSFSNSSTISEGNLTYLWDFGDGNNSTGQNPDHTYASDGIFNVTLTASSTEGCSDTHMESVEVFPEPSTNFTYIEACYGDSTIFTNSSTLSSGTMTYVWDFGDGQTSTASSPQHLYTSFGTYQVVLTATSVNSCVDVIQKAVTTHPNPVADFDNTNACIGNPVSFQNQSTISSGSLSYQWDFGDGNNAMDEDPDHLYSTPGEFSVILVVTSGNNCRDTISSTVEIYESSVGGSISGSTTKCSGDVVSDTLFLTGHTGSITRWERSANGVNQWLTIENTTNILVYSDLTESTYYRAAVVNGECTESFSSQAIVQVDQPTVGGTLSGGKEVCADANVGTFYLSGHTGDVVQWHESAVSDSGPWTPVSNNTDSLTYMNLDQTTWYRAEVKSGECSSSFSDVVGIIVHPETVVGILQGAATVCQESNGDTLILSGYTGDILRWETSPNGMDPWSTINNATDELIYVDLASTTYFRAVVQSGVCQELVSNEVVINVDEDTDPGVVGGAASVCAGRNEGTLTLTDFVGQPSKWQSSTDQTDWMDIPNFTATQDFNDLEETTYYRVHVKNGTCQPAISPALEVRVDPLPEVSFSVDTVCHGETSVFQNASTISEGEISSYLWDFGTGEVAALGSPQHVFDEGGIYSVTLVATSDAGCVDSVAMTTVVNEVPAAGFETEDVCEGDSVVFQNVSIIGTGSIVSIAWDFGDSESSDTENVSHLYSKADDYPVSLTVTSDQNCSQTVDKTVSVHPGPGTSFEVEDICLGQEVQFENTSAISNGNLVYTWNFGDGNASNETNPDHQYDETGTYNVLLKATSHEGCESTVIHEVNVFNQPMAAFEAADNCFDSVIVFENTSTGEQLAVEWSLGDGNMSDDVNPAHQYASPGTYNVHLIVENPAGCGNEATGFVTVYPMPQASFDAPNRCEGESIEFSNLSTIITGEMTYEWDFGGSTSSASEPDHLFVAAGEYSVQLKAMSEFGCVDTISKTVMVHPNPVPDFIVEPVCEGNGSTFVNLSSIETGGIASWLWDFGDQTNATIGDPVKQYGRHGSYDVTLTATSDQGCVSSTTQQARVNERPKAVFTVEDVCRDELLEIDNTSTVSSGELTFDWDFGDGITSVATRPEHQYDQAGVYTISLIASTAEQCADTLRKPVIIYELPVVDAGPDTTISQGFGAQLSASEGSAYSWRPITGLNNSNVQAPLASPLETTTYQVTVTDMFGCTNTDSVTVNVMEDFRITATNVFTPDGNGINDAWKIENVETFGTVNVRVFDRYGKIVFEDEAYQNDWTGTAGKDILPDGTYYYLITFSDADVKYRGSLTIIRNR